MKRLDDFIDKILATINIWNLKKPKNKFPQIDPLMISPGGKNLFEQMNQHWKENCAGVPDKAIIISPFYNPPEDKHNQPAQLIWNILKKRGKASVLYNTRGENLEDGMLVKAPETLKTKAPNYRKDVSTDIRIIDELIKNENKVNLRPFHFKTIWMENSEYLVCMIGSSNFTSAGTGLNRTHNFEANLLYTIHKKRDPKNYKQMRNYVITGKDPGTNIQFLKEAEINEDEEGADELRPLPSCFEKLILKIEEGKNHLEIHFIPPLPQEFLLFGEDEKILYSEKQWTKNKKPDTVLLKWEKESIPSGIFVKWKDSNGYAYWPVMIEDQKNLPPVDDLKDLPLEFLIRLITSARPLYQVLKSWHKRKEEEKNGPYPDTKLDPHKRVDVSSYLLQRTRRVSNLLTAFRERLERPVYTIEALHWRIYGPVGIEAISKAISKEGHSDEEKSFILSELSLELSRMNYKETPTSISKETVEAEITKMIKKFEKQFKKTKKTIDPEMRKYISKAYKTSLK